MKTSLLDSLLEDGLPASELSEPPKEYAICCRQTGRDEEADRIEAVLPGTRGTRVLPKPGRMVSPEPLRMTLPHA